MKIFRNKDFRPVNGEKRRGYLFVTIHPRSKLRGILDKQITFFRRLQSRPRHERRIMGLAAYVAAAALVTVFWLNSLEQSLKLAPAIKESATMTESGLGRQETKEAPKPDKKTASAPEQITPLEALKQATASAAAGFRELAGEIKRLGKESAALQIPLPVENPLPKTEPKPPEPNKTEVSGRETDASPAKILRDQMQAKTYSAYVTARLIRPPAGLAAEETSATASRIKNILYYNLGEMRQAAVDFYRYLTE